MPSAAEIPVRSVTAANVDHIACPCPAVVVPVFRGQPVVIYPLIIPSDVVFNDAHIEDDRVGCIIPNQGRTIAAVVGDNQVGGLERCIRQAAAAGKVDQLNVLGGAAEVGHIDKEGVIAVDGGVALQAARSQCGETGSAQVKGEAVVVFELPEIHRGGRAVFKHSRSVIKVPPTAGQCGL